MCEKYLSDLFDLITDNLLKQYELLNKIRTNLTHIGIPLTQYFEIQVSLIKLEKKIMALKSKAYLLLKAPQIEDEEELKKVLNEIDDLAYSDKYNYIRLSPDISLN
ncbi:Uncharacterised protein [uncultured archaeon]|nr:Uncharacterised protein [uncultured archaeon]